MRFNTKIRYGLRTMIELSMADRNKGLLQKEISKSQEISEKYLDHIIASLKISGLIKNSKGKKSGYKLTKDPANITINQIFQAFEPELSVVECLADIDFCNRNVACAARLFWQNLNNIIVQFLNSVTLDKLSDQQKELKKKQKVDYMYYI